VSALLVRPSRAAIVAVLMSLVLAVHFALTLAYLTPANPIRLEHQGPILAYMEPFFSQNWSLFAPDPTVDTRYLLVACRRHSDGPDEHAGWINITAPLRRTRADDRLGPVLAIERNQMGPLHSVFAPEDPLMARLAATDPVTYEPVISRYKAMRDAAAVECDRQHGAGATVAVGMRMVIIQSPPFSKRHEPLETGKTDYVELPWGPYERVATY
jgi:hypothetical protein